MLYGSRSRHAGTAQRSRPFAWVVLLATILAFFAAPAQYAFAQQNDQSGIAAQQEVQSTPGNDLAGANERRVTGTSRLEVHIVECPEEYPGGTGDDFFNDCHANGMDNVQVRLTTLSIEQVKSQQSGDGRGGAFPTDYDQMLMSQRTDNSGPGIAVFDGLQADDYTVVVDLPGATYNFYSYCSFADSDQSVPVAPNDENNGVISLADGQNVICDWYIIPDPNGTLQSQIEAGGNPTPTATATVGGAQDIDNGDATVEPGSTVESGEENGVGGETSGIGGAATGDAQIVIDMRTCPDTFGDPRSANLGAFQNACVDGTGGVVLRLTSEATGAYVEQTTQTRLNNTFSNLPDGTYSMYSNIPGDAASEYLFCQANNGTVYQKEFNENGVTVFLNLTGEQIFCNWYVVPEDARGDETGASLTVHLASCPGNYSGNTYFDDCHNDGIDDSEFILSGPNNLSMSATTSTSRVGGPGVAAFTGLPSGNYTLAGGPPGDFGTAVVYCSNQADGSNTRIPVQLSSTRASFTIEDGQDLLCDWYFIPEGQPTPEPTPRAEILITMFNCEPRTDGYAGWGFGDLDDTCTEPVNDVPFRLGAEGGTPLTAKTGVSGEGAVRFYDLLPGTFTATATLPGDLASVAVFCSIDDSTSVYQKSLSNGSVTFLNVEGEHIGCSWFVTSPVEEPSGNSGTITVREYICASEKSEITDWEKECGPGATGSAYALSSSDGSVETEGTPNDEGVLVFTKLPDGFYNLKQVSGTWCRATAEHVDSSSRVIVNGGGNTDVYLYHCGDVTALPSTGTGTVVNDRDEGMSLPLWATLVAIGILLLAVGSALRFRVRTGRATARPEPQEHELQPERLENGMYRMRFR